MNPHTRAMIAAAAFSYVTGKKAAGVYDHSTGRNLQIAAESRGDQLQGFDGDRGAQFGGALPELYDAGDKSYVSMEISGSTVSGYDRSTSGFYSAEVANGAVQVFDRSNGTWFAYDIQDPASPRAYHRDAAMGG